MLSVSENNLKSGSENDLKEVHAEACTSYYNVFFVIKYSGNPFYLTTIFTVFDSEAPPGACPVSRAIYIPDGRSTLTCDT